MITVGAADPGSTSASGDDFNAPWSAFGSTPDGFAKPELGAVGRYMNGAVPATAAIPAMLPDRILEPGYMWMSGTSFAAPIVSGAAALLVALHPGWTPDQIKGALMLTAAQPSSSTAGFSLGVGLVQAADAAAVSDPPNPNEGLNQFVVGDGSGGQIFDTASWSSAAEASASWSRLLEQRLLVQHQLGLVTPLSICGTGPGRGPSPLFAFDHALRTASPQAAHATIEFCLRLRYGQKLRSG